MGRKRPRIPNPMNIHPMIRRPIVLNWFMVLSVSIYNKGTTLKANPKSFGD
jgi:hypothetical protein